MKLAIAIIGNVYTFGCQANIAICDEKDALFLLRNISGDVDEIDVRLYQVEEETPLCNFSEGFISNEGKMEIHGYKPYEYKYLCNLTSQL